MAFTVLRERDPVRPAHIREIQDALTGVSGAGQAITIQSLNVNTTGAGTGMVRASGTLQAYGAYAAPSAGAVVIGYDSTPFGFIAVHDGSVRKKLRFIANVYEWVDTGDNVKLQLLDNGNVLIGTTTDSGEKLQVNGDLIRLVTAKTPASAGAAGNAGDICWDSNYIYVCVATDTWKRAALSAW